MSPPAFGAQDLDHEVVLGGSRDVGEQSILHFPNLRVHVLWIALILLAVAGWADVISAVPRNTILQTAVAEPYRSRISSV